MKRTRAVIQWRVKSQAEFLPKGDLSWSEFCTIEENGTHDGSACIALGALKSDSQTTVEMEFRKKP